MSERDRFAPLLQLISISDLANMLGEPEDCYFKFRTEFERLKEFADDAPEELADQAASDASVWSCCLSVIISAHFVKIKEQSATKIIVGPLDRNFTSQWRDYQNRYEPTILQLFYGYSSSDTNESERSERDLLDQFSAMESAYYIDGVFEFAQKFIDRNMNTDQDKLINDVQIGIDDWRKLRDEGGLELEKIFYRRRRVPIVYIRRQVAVKKRTQANASIVENLEQAYQAFIFGAPFAAIALIRSVIESVLREHYHAQGATLDALIDDAQIRHPKMRLWKLHYIRMIANYVLHMGHRPSIIREGNLEEDEGDLISKLEEQIVEFFNITRDLIEKSI